MSLRPALLAILTLSTGCDMLPEHWFAYDDAELEVLVDDVAIVDAVVYTSPDAWPKDLYSSAVRVGLDDAQVEVVFLGEVVDGVLVDEERDLNFYDDRNVGVLDAWRDCVPDQECERVFRFGVACLAREAVCQGHFEGDAFLSTVGLRPENDRGGWLELTFIQRDATGE
jgi:hypothetical protein